MPETVTALHDGARADVERADPVESACPTDDAGEERGSVVTLLARRVVPMALLFGVFAVMVRTASQPLDNSDTYFHLRFGHEFLSGAWSLSHPGSVTTWGTADWAPTQWLPQVVMAQLEDWWGLPGVAWFSGFQFIVFSVAVFVTARRWSAPVVAGPLTMFVVIAAAPGLSMRPQVMSYALVAVTAAAWMHARESGRPPWLLIPLTWFWATYHGMWPVGIVLGLVIVLGLRLDGVVKGRGALRYLAVPLLASLAAAVTPVGPRLYGAVLLVNSRGRYFSEWGPPHLTAPNVMALLVVLGVTGVILLRDARTPWVLVLVLALAAGAGIYSQRTVPVAAAMLTPVAAIALQSLVGSRPHVGRRERSVVLSGAALALVVLALVVPHTAAKPAPQPSWVAPTLSALPRGTAILNDSGYGGYLMWAYPQLDVVLSGYGDLYTDDELEKNSQMGDVAPGWDDLVRETGARVAMMSTDSALGYALEQDGWTVEQTSEDVRYLKAPTDW